MEWRWDACLREAEEDSKGTPMRWYLRPRRRHRYAAREGALRSAYPGIAMAAKRGLLVSRNILQCNADMYLPDKLRGDLNTIFRKVGATSYSRFSLRLARGCLSRCG